HENHKDNNINIINPSNSTSTSLAQSSSTTTNLPVVSKYDKDFFFLTEQQKAQCKYCKMMLSFKKENGTSHLKRHLSTCRSYLKLLANEASLAKLTKGQTQLKFNFLNEQPNLKDSTRTDIANMIIRDELIFQFVEGQGFHNFIYRLLSNFTISADTIKQDIMKTYDKRKLLIKEILLNSKGKISLTCDLWTSSQQLGYIAITAHFLNINWNLISILISFRLIPFPHFGINIANSIKDETDKYCITNK
ncbi:4349_t:CDS:1, partial [Cetraspora pellucida]